jgi:CheY-like chemotaxis protein
MSTTDCSVYTANEQQRISTHDEKRLQLWDSPELVASYRKICRPAQSLKVLLAEDNLIDQISIRRLLEKEGAEVTVVGDGRQAVDMFDCSIFDFILLDILMPDIDGFETAVQIREKERQTGSRIPIIALTSYSLKAISDKCRSVGMSGYISKPVSSGDLRKLFSFLLPETL